MRQVIIHAPGEHRVADERIVDKENAGICQAAAIGVAVLNPLAQNHEERECREQRQDPQQTKKAPRPHVVNDFHGRDEAIDDGEPRHPPNGRGTMRDDRIDFVFLVVTLRDGRIVDADDCPKREHGASRPDRFFYPEQHD